MHALPLRLPLQRPLGAIEDFWGLLQRIWEWLAIGGTALAAAVGLVFLLTWVLTHMRQAQAQARPLLSQLALACAYPAVLLTAIASIGLLVPGMQPLMLKSFALAVLLAAGSWCLGVAAVLSGGNAHDLARARRALALAGTPWYCLAIYLALHL